MAEVEDINREKSACNLIYIFLCIPQPSIHIFIPSHCVPQSFFGLSPPLGSKLTDEACARYIINTISFNPQNRLEKKAVSSPF